MQRRSRLNIEQLASGIAYGMETNTGAPMTAAKPKSPRTQKALMDLATSLSERDVTKQVRSFLESRGWAWFRLQSGTVRGMTRGTPIRLNKKGTPDAFAVRGRECLFVELKRLGKIPSPEQKQWMNWAEIMGIMAIWCDSIEVFQQKYGRIFPR